MDRHPPHSQAEIQELVSQYLDGALEPDMQRQLEALLDEFTIYGEELSRLQALRSKVQQATGQSEPDGLHYNKVSDGIWQNVFSQLQADGDAELMEADPEFICAYYDREIPATDVQLKAFEAQLYRNDEANRLLGGFGQISETVRQFGYRLEATCTLDITHSVMSAYLAEVDGQALADATPQWELLSAYVDQELSGKEIIEANRLIENDPTAKATVGSFALLSERLKSISEELQQQAPDLWPAVKSAYEAEPDKIVQLPRNHVTPLKKALRIGIPIAAAAILLLIAIPLANDSGTFSGLASQSKQDALVAKQASAGASADQAELASADGAANEKFRNRNEMEVDLDAPMLDEPASQIAPAEGNVMSSPGRMGGAGGSLKDDAPSAPSPVMAEGLGAKKESQHAEADLKPMLDSTPVASKALEEKSKRQDAGRYNSVGPSSEEYLFNSLSQQMSEEEIASLLAPGN